MNLAGVLPWIHWRGLLVLGLLVAGNVFCMACPFTAAAHAGAPLASRGHGPGRAGCAANGWPSACSCCFCGPTRRSPSGTARGGPPGSRSATSRLAFVIDGLFRGAAFCKYVCPIGQFNFVQSLVSPLEVKVRDHERLCVVPDQGLHPRQRRHPRLRARAVPAAQGEQPRLHLLPRLRSRLPARQHRHPRRTCPGKALWHDRSAPASAGSANAPTWRHSVVLTFGAFANAAGMVGPVVEWQDQLASLLKLRSPRLLTTASTSLASLSCRSQAIHVAAALSRFAGERTASEAGDGHAIFFCPWFPSGLACG